MVDDTPKTVAIPSSTGNEIRPRVGIPALSTFLHPRVKSLRWSLLEMVDIHHPQAVTRHRQDGSNPKVIAGMTRLPEDACTEARCGDRWNLCRALACRGGRKHQRHAGRAPGCPRLDRNRRD